MSLLKIQISQPKDHTQQFSLQGSLDVNTSEQFSQAIDDNIAPDTQVVILDLSELDYISSAGLRIIFKLRKIVKSNNSKIYVVNPQPQIQKVFDIVKAIPLNSVFSSVEELDRYLDSIQKKFNL